MAFEILFVKVLFFVSLTSSRVASRAVILGEQSFDSPPTNLTVDKTSQFVLLDNETNIIPGWPYQGTVWYYNAYNYSYLGSLTGKGNGLQLGPNGMISYTFYGAATGNYFLTFRLAPSSPYCANNATAVNVSAPSFSKVFFYKESIEKEPWQTHACSFRGYYYVTLKIESVVAIGNIACWPIIDDLLLTGINSEEMRENNSVVFNEFWNNGFEVGPGSPLYFTQGIILEAESNLGTFSSGKLALDPWIVIGTVKYIDSNHYAIPQGRRAVELISASGNPSGIAYNATYISEKIQYTLEFIMGDAGDSCMGDFMVVALVGPLKWNFMMRSNGLGSSNKYSVKFQLNRTYSSNNAEVTISFVSYNETRTSDHQELCGPVIDAMFLGTPRGLCSATLPSGLVIFVSIVIFFFFA